MTKDVLFITTGNKRTVFRSTEILYRIEPLLSSKDTLHILTDINNVDLFWDLSSFSFETKVYAAFAESYITLSTINFSDIFLFYNTEFGEAIYKRIRLDLLFKLSMKMISSAPKEHLFTPSSLNKKYFFHKYSYPIDFIHKRMSKKSKFIVGVNLGNDESHTTKRIPFSIYESFLEKINVLTESRFVIFGSHKNSVRVQMIQHLGLDIIDMTDIKYAPFLGEAIRLCDVIISPDDFIMHLSLALQQKTVGIFFLYPEYETFNFPFLRKIITKSNCPLFPCYDDTKPCKLISQENFEESCIYNINVDEIVSATTDFLIGGN